MSMTSLSVCMPWCEENNDAQRSNVLLLCVGNNDAEGSNVLLLCVENNDAEGSNVLVGCNVVCVDFDVDVRYVEQHV